MAVLYSEYLGIRKRTPYISSSLGKISLHWGSCVRLPIRTKLRIGLLRADRMAAWPIDCKTMWIIPEAMSSGEALPSAFPKLEAVASSGRSGRGLLQMSCIWRSIFVRVPFRAISAIRWMSCVFRSRRESPSKVPPPMPMPPICWICGPSTFTKEVPVPMLTTIRFSSEAVYLAPRPLARNSSVLAVGKPYSGWSMKALPTPVSITISISGKVIPLS